MKPGDQYRQFARCEIEQSIPARFDKQVRAARYAIAVRAYGRTLRYGELAAEANRIAGAVAAAAGEQPEPVLVAMDQSAMLPAAILGILKAGHFYVPIEAGSKDIARLVAHTGARVAVCDEKLDLPGLHVVAAESAGGAGRIGSSGADALAYIYYTSGTTGAPKGVMDNHRNVLHNIMRYTNSLKIGAGDRLTLLQTPGFSGAVSGMFCALLNGAACYPIAPRHETAASLAALVQSNQLTMWHSVPSLFRQLCASGERFPSVRVVRLEGDQAAPGDVALFRAHFSADSVLVNGLGATETGLTRQYFVMPNTMIPPDTLPAGYPVEDMEAVLSQDGELGIKSRFLALGYWKEPELTQARFIPCGDGRRMYLTGDLARLAEDGCLTLAGRKDHAVKIAGNRVDIAGIEAALSALPGIEQALVAALPDRRNELRLRAWVVFRDRQQPAINGIRRALADRLPPHSVPASFLAVDALPVTANGKVDRRALVVPEPGRPLMDVPFAPPQTDSHRQVAAIWREILGIDPIGIDDDFFELGASSLDLARLAGELPFDMERFAGGLTVRRLAEWIDLPRETKGLVRIREGVSTALFCVPPHSGVLAGFHNLARRLGPGPAVYGFAPVEVVDCRHPFTIPELAGRYIELMRTVQPSGPYVICGHCFGGLVAYEMACLLKESGEHVALLAMVECYNDGWFRGQSKWKQTALLLRHGMRQVRRHAFRGPAHWRSLAVRAVELLEERRLQDQFEVSLAQSQPVPEQLQRSSRANRLAARTFRPRPYSGRVLLLEEDEPGATEYPSTLMGWEGLLWGEKALYAISGARRGLLSEPAVRQTAGRIDADLAGIAQHSLVLP
ncbi:MAG: AMP-binding protein [Bryobacteraceae bacterium]|nr:AMP-binding protein [Bryobacteraceae bacterium]